MTEVSLRVTEITPQVIEYIWQRIVEAIHPLRIVLFGSQARDEAQHGSDLDLLVIHDTPQPDRQVRRQSEQLFLDRRFGLDLIVRRPEEVAMNLADGNPFYTHHTVCFLCQSAAEKYLKGYLIAQGWSLERLVMERVEHQ